MPGLKKMLKKFLLNCAFISLLLFPSLGLGIQIKGSAFYSGNWQGNAYTSNKTGKFSHCAISTQYKSGYMLLFSVNANSSITVSLAHSKPIFRGVKDFPLTLQIDRRQPIYSTARYISDKQVGLTLPDMAKSMWAFKKGRLLIIKSYLGDLPFYLDGTFKALDQTYECARKYYNFKETLQAKRKPIDNSLIYQAVTTMITDLNLKKFSFIPEAEIPAILPGSTSKNTVLWQAYDRKLIGGVQYLYEPEVKNLKSTDPSDMSYLSSLCAGDIMTGARNISGTDNKVRELMSVCDDGNEVRNTFLTKFRFGDYTFYNFFSIDASIEEIPNPKSVNKNLSLKVVNFIEGIK